MASLTDRAHNVKTLVKENSPFALTTARVAGRDQAVFRHGPKTLAEIYAKVGRLKDAPFLVTDGGSVSRHALMQRAAAYAALYTARGVTKGMRVPLVHQDDADWIASFIALTFLGAVAVLINGSGVQALHQVAAADCDTAIVEDTSGVGWNSAVGTSELAAAYKGQIKLPEPDIDAEQEACIAFTSGSSGNPKGAILTHRGMTTGLMNMMLAGAVAAYNTPGARQPVARPVTATVLLRTPLSHVSAYMQVLLMFMLGGRIVRSQRTDIRGLITDHQITSVTGISDEEIAMLLAAPSEETLCPLRSIAVVGRSLPAKLRHAVRQSLPGLGVGSGYGLTETNGLIAAIGNSELDSRTRAVGMVLPTAECRILDKNGEECAAGESGTIWLRGAMLMRGYCNAPDLAASDDRSCTGWFNTGDIGYLSQDGYLHVLDKDDRFLRAGAERISCRDIEDAAREASDTVDVAAICIPGPQDRLMIAVAGPADLSAIREALSLQFPAELIRQARIMTAKRLPRTSSGKIAYAKLLADATP